MDDPIQDPVRKDGRRYEAGRSRGSTAHSHSVQDERTDRPQDRRNETVRVGHVEQVERIGRGDSRNDADLLDAEQNERRPYDIEPLNGDEENPQRHGWVALLNREADTVVTNKHGVLRDESPTEA